MTQEFGQQMSRDQRSHDIALRKRTMKAIALLSVLLVGACASSVPLTDLRLPKNVSASNVWALLVAGSNGYDNYRHQVGHRCVHPHTSLSLCLRASAFSVAELPPN